MKNDIQSRGFAKFTTCPHVGGVQLLHAVYTRHEFLPHYHEGHVIGVIEKGCLGFDYRGEKLVAGPGEINIADPGEVHNGFGMSESGWQYRMFYLQPGQLDQIANEMADRKTPMPFFRKGVVRDPVFARKIHELHRDFENPETDCLEKESRFRLLFSQFLLRHGGSGVRQMAPGREHRIVIRIQDYIRQYYDTRLTLSDLSREAGVSPYYLLRVFASQTGMTPHAYMSHVRVEKAKQLIEGHVPIVDAALQVGLCDQSHLNRLFKKIVGITPGQYFNAVQ